MISSIPVPDIDAYHRARYTGGQHRRRRRRQRRAREDRRARQAPRRAADRRRRRRSAGRRREVDGAQIGFQQKDTEQFHICFGGPGIDRSDERRYALAHSRRRLRRLDLIAALPRGSREAGLAYAVGSYTQQYVDSGMIGIYVGTREDNVEEACEIIGRELASIHADGITDDELTRAKEHVKGRMVLSSESTAARMGRIGKSLLFDTPLLTLDELLEKVDAVSSDDVAELARELYAPRFALGRRRSRRARTASAAALAPVERGACAAGGLSVSAREGSW